MRTAGASAELTGRLSAPHHRRMALPEGFTHLDLTGIDPRQQLAALDRADSEESLYEFLKNSWRIFDSAPWIDGWALDAICEHLQAVIDGQIKRLIINVPPRCAKSASCSVALVPWTWAQPDKSHTSGPGVSFLYASFKDNLSLRDSVKCRRVIESPWFQTNWSERFQLTTDQNTKSRFSNNQGGERLITSIGDKGATGEGGDIIVVDDGNSAKEVESEAVIESTLDWWDGTMSTRLNNPKLGAYIEIQQRLGENDLTGHIISKSRGEWTHLMLPMEYDPERSFSTLIGWKDPRTEEGELLWPERFGKDEVDSLKVSLGEWRAAGQLQQAPQPRGGGVIKRAWWQLWEGTKYPQMDFTLGTLDTAYTLETMNDPSGMIVWGIFSDGLMASATRMLDISGNPIYADRTYESGTPKAMCMYAWTERYEFHELVKRTVKTCIDTGVNLLLIENKAAGISVAQEIRRLYSNEKFSVQLFDPKSQDKFARLVSVQHIFQEGMVYAPNKEWAEAVITQVGAYPRSKHDEYVDLTSMGLRHLRDTGLLTRAPERLADIEASKVFTGNQNAALYEC